MHPSTLNQLTWAFAGPPDHNPRQLITTPNTATVNGQERQSLVWWPYDHG